VFISVDGVFIFLFFHSSFSYFHKFERKLVIINLRSKVINEDIVRFVVTNCSSGISMTIYRSLGSQRVITLINFMAFFSPIGCNTKLSIRCSQVKL
jgi:hypothetical protein